MKILYCLDFCMLAIYFEIRKYDVSTSSFLIQACFGNLDIFVVICSFRIFKYCQKKCHSNFNNDYIKPWDRFSMYILKMLSLIVQVFGMSFHVVVSYLISLINIFFSFQCVDQTWSNLFLSVLFFLMLLQMGILSSIIFWDRKSVV